MAGARAKTFNDFFLLHLVRREHHEKEVSIIIMMDNISCLRAFDRKCCRGRSGAHYGRRGGLCGARYRVFENPGMADKEVDLG